MPLNQIVLEYVKFRNICVKYVQQMMSFSGVYHRCFPTSSLSMLQANRMPSFRYAVSAA